MAKNNYFALVNFTGEPAKITVNGVTVSTRPADHKVLPRKEEKGSREILMSNHKLPNTTDQFDVTIEVESENYNGTVTIPNFKVSSGTNSWSTFSFQNTGGVHAFPSYNSADYQI